MSETTQPTLFPGDEGFAEAPAGDTATAPTMGPPRLRLPERCQIAMHCESLDQRLAQDHLARAIWTYVEGLDLTPLLRGVKAVEGHVGRDATDPRILLSLWLLAYAEGCGSARRLDKLCTRDRAYEWLCGSVTVNYHLLANFRVQHWDFLSRWFTKSLAAFMHEGLLDLDCTAQDGMRVRASAGTSSFRRRATLEKCLNEARKHVEKLDEDFQDGSATATLQQQAAQERAAQERLQRVENALKQVEELEQKREARKKGSGSEARASTTDPDARKMKFADGGYRPGYNVQFTTDTASGLIVGVDVTNQGTDAGLMDPMLDDVEKRTGQLPDKHLADGGFSTIDDIEKVSARGCTVFTPVKEVDKKQAAGIDPYQAQPGDSPALGDWRQRMGTDEARETYKLRAQTAEWTNAQARNRNLYRVNVRGLPKVRTIALWYVLVHNLLCMLRLRDQQASAASPPT